MSNTQNKIRTALIAFSLLCAWPAQAEIYIINTQTLDPEQLGPGSGHSLSNIEANRRILLDYYHYTDQQQAVLNRRQATQDLAYKIEHLKQTGADKQTLADINSQLKQLQNAAHTALPELSKFALPEFKQLHQIEQENAAQLENLQQQSAKIPTTPNITDPPARLPVE
ncbi:hypothetical protein LVJ83_08685 [Uruburuella testudinis]|uniref:Uncharacterized protein n=1 Tax=Uruburuella testudinis TaxID=1282863 RepID=A0ABY4DPU1_9NEIS|nr:hypothetical protein [Uruburuella testudinis]UOO81055.1 hypothetical protein LVJ83_08685 [Uruburuella testudinis]